jgi:glycerate dehydrogenase
MRIVYLDEPSYLPDESIQKLESIGEFQVFHDRPDQDTARSRLADAEIAIVEWTDLPASIFEDSGRLKHVVLVTTGYGSVDVAAANAHGISVSNTPYYSRQSVAEHVFALFLALSKRIIEADKLSRENPHASYTDHVLGKELCRARLGILGYGSIGSYVAQIGRGFDMEVVAFTRRDIPDPKIARLDLDELLATSDYVAACLPVGPPTEGILNRERLASMKSDSILVNIAGNSILDEAALGDLLQSGHLFGAGLEHATAPELLAAPNTIITAGTAWYTAASIQRNIDMVIETVETCVAGSPRFTVSPRS